MRKIALSVVLVLTGLAMQAQPQRGVKGGYDVTEFPKVSFVWNTPNPDLLDSSRFALSENEKPLAITVQALPVENSKTIKKSVLVLWEDMASHSRQSEFTRTVLDRFFREASLCSTDRFNVAVFNRQRDSRPHVLAPLLADFTSDGARLAEEVSSYKRSGEYFSSFPQQSDLYLAINEGIGLLKKEPSDRSGVLVVVTAGLNVKASGASTEMETVRKNALEAGIPVYVIKYPLTGNAPEVNTLAESTFGLVSSSVNADAATNGLKDFYRQFDNRLCGRDYKITFTTESKRDGKDHRLRFKVDKVDRPVPPYKAPNMTFGMWLSKYCWLALLGVLVLAGGLVLIILSVKKRERTNQAIQEQMRREHEESERRNREAMDNMRREQEEKERTASDAIARAKEAADEERLASLMRNKNLLPRLQCKTGNTVFSYTIGKPRVTLGRNADNDVAFTERNDRFDNMTVSGHHAEIVFTGSAFEVVNVSLSYTQGIIVNGQLCQRHSLRSGDMIGLGEALVTFYV